MGSLDGFMKIERDLPETRDPKDRIKDLVNTDQVLSTPSS